MFGSDDIAETGRYINYTFGCISRQLAERTQVGYHKESNGLGGDPETGPGPNSVLILHRSAHSNDAAARDLGRPAPLVWCRYHPAWKDIQWADQSKPPPRGAQSVLSLRGSSIFKGLVGVEATI